MSDHRRFGRFEIHPAERQLMVDGQAAKLGARAFDLLLALFERRDRTVPKSELLDLVWPGLVVEENNLQVQVSTLRKLLGPQAIATIPGRGYRFTAAPGDADDGNHRRCAPVQTPATNHASGLAKTPSNLPRELPPLYGRGTALAELCSLIDAHRLVTVVGAGGIGKSRLAQAVAHSLAGRWPDGAWMIELAGLSDPMLVPNAVAQVLGIRLAGAGTALDALVAGIASRSALLVLDNCEHLLAPVVALVQGMLRGAANVTVLCTSQEPLHLSAEQQYRLSPLTVPSDSCSDAREFGAVALFEARVRAVDPRFSMDDDSLALAIEICRRLDGLPLAIELAAARVATLGLRTVRDKLDVRFRLLSTGHARATLPRHQTLRAALEWSHKLLNESEKTVFRRLGVFAGGFTVDLAQAVAVDAQLDEWAVLDHLSALVDKSLVVAETGDAPRYRLLESARAFALEQLAAAELAATRKRHALAMQDFLERVDGANLDGELRTDQFAAQVLPELDNLRAAHAWASSDAGDFQVAVSLAAHAGALIDYAVECVEWLLPLKQRVDDAAVDAAVAARYWRAMAAMNMVGRVPCSVQLEAANRAQSLYRALGQPRRTFSSLIQLAGRLRAQRDEMAARTVLDEARSLIRPDWPTEFRILLLRADRRLARHAGRLAEALSLTREAVRLGMSTGDWRLEVIERNSLVDILWDVGPIEEAAQVACKLAEELRARPAGCDDMAVFFANMMGIHCEMGQLDAAWKAACEALPNMRQAHRCYLEEWVYFFWRSGRIDSATQFLGASDAHVLRTGEALQPNEARLIAEARAALQARLHPDLFASGHADGAALSEAKLFARISEALAQPPSAPPLTGS